MSDDPDERIAELERRMSSIEGRFSALTEDYTQIRHDVNQLERRPADVADIIDFCPACGRESEDRE